MTTSTTSCSTPKPPLRPRRSRPSAASSLEVCARILISSPTPRGPPPPGPRRRVTSTCRGVRMRARGRVRWRIPRAPGTRGALPGLCGRRGTCRTGGPGVPRAPEGGAARRRCATARDGGGTRRRGEDVSHSRLSPRGAGPAEGRVEWARWGLGPQQSLLGRGLLPWQAARYMLYVYICICIYMPIYIYLYIYMGSCPGRRPRRLVAVVSLYTHTAHCTHTPAQARRHGSSAWHGPWAAH